MELAYQEPSSENSLKYLLVSGFEVGFLSVQRGLSLVQMEALQALVNTNSSEFIGRCREIVSIGVKPL